MKKKEDRKDFSFLHLCLVGKIRKSGRMKFFLVWLRQKMRGLKIEFV